MNEPDLTQVVQIFVFELIVNCALIIQATALLLDGLEYSEWWSVRVFCVAFFLFESVVKLIGYGIDWAHAPLPSVDCALTVVSVTGQLLQPQYYVLFQALVRFLSASSSTDICADARCLLQNERLACL